MRFAASHYSFTVPKHVHTYAHLLKGRHLCYSCKSLRQSQLMQINQEFSGSVAHEMPADEEPIVKRRQCGSNLCVRWGKITLSKSFSYNLTPSQSFFGQLYVIPIMLSYECYAQPLEIRLGWNAANRILP